MLEFHPFTFSMLYIFSRPFQPWLRYGYGALKLASCKQCCHASLPIQLYHCCYLVRGIFFLRAVS